jgi:hypothetical protein
LLRRGAEHFSQTKIHPPHISNATVLAISVSKSDLVKFPSRAFNKAAKKAGKWFERPSEPALNGHLTKENLGGETA